MSMLRALPSRFAESDRMQSAQAMVLEWLKSGLEPRQLAFTLALGFALGCIPLLGMTTALCALAALALGLNMPAIQAANWLAMPFQLVLLVPILRFGQWLFPGHGMALDRGTIVAQIRSAPGNALLQMGWLFGHGLVAWLVVAAPAAVMMTVLLTPLLRRISQRISTRSAELIVLAGD
jgi:uncharacterized protein (DUF2062 family)